jgi:hypothetical protein
MMTRRGETEVTERTTAAGQEGRANAHRAQDGQGKPDGTITVTVNGSPVVLSERSLSGASLKLKADIPADYELYVVHGSSTKPIADGDTIHVHEGSAFRAIPPGTFGARSR